jgi:SOS-response transcriptional repressor LexA
MKTNTETRKKQLTLLIKEHRTIKALSEVLDRSPAQVSQWKNGSKDSKTGRPRVISDDMARHIENKCGKPVGWLDNESGHLEINNVSALPQSNLIPLISWVQAGEFCDTGHLSPLDDTTAYYPCPVLSAGPNTFALIVKGDSMTASSSGTRSYPEGSIIYVDPDVPADTGKRIIARVGEEMTFKQLMEGENGKQYLKPLNDRHPLILPKDDMHICGVVIGSFLPE